METHGVEASLLEHTPSQSVLIPPQELSKQALQIAGNVLPYVAVVLVYVATQVAAKMKVRDFDAVGSCLGGWKLPGLLCGVAAEVVIRSAAVEVGV